MTLLLAAGCGSAIRSAATGTVSAKNALQTRDVDPDPAFITGDGAIPGRFAVTLVAPELDAVPGQSQEIPADPSQGAPGPDSPGMAQTQSVAQPVEPAPVDSVATALCSQYGGTVGDKMNGIKAFVAVSMTEAQARAMSHDARVLSVTADLPYYSDSVQYTSGPNDWGLDTIDQTSRPRNYQFNYVSQGYGVHVYVLDTGINKDLPEFGGRASWDYSAVNGKSPNDDSANSHGTHLASIVGGTVYGVAKSVRLHSVKVVEGATISGGKDPAYVTALLKGVDWVKNHKIKPAVANMSFGGDGIRYPGNSWSALDTAARRLANSGVTVVVSAGNENRNASTVSPANVSELIVVAASDRNFNRAVYFPPRNAFDRGSASNYGDRIDLFAPGDVVTSADRYGNGAAFGGTSAAAPYVAGVAAQALQYAPAANHYDVQKWLRLYASPPGKMQATGDLNGSVNKFLYTYL